jgi:hypothetical protein
VHNDNIYDKFFQSVKSVFHLYCDPKYSYLIPSSRSLIPSSHSGGERVGLIFFGVFQTTNTSSTNKCKSYRTKCQIIPISNLHLCSSSQAVKVNSCKGMTWYVKIV